MAEKVDTSIPELTESFRKARRNLTTASAILLFWEYVGVTVSSATEQSVSLFGIQIGLQNAEAVPTVIFFLTVYFSLRLYLEWLQVSDLRRAIWSARMDVFTTAAITVLAIIIFLAQTFSYIRVADVINEEQATLGLTILVMIAATAYSFSRSRKLYRQYKTQTDYTGTEELEELEGVHEHLSDFQKAQSQIEESIARKSERLQEAIGDARRRMLIDGVVCIIFLAIAAALFGNWAFQK